MRVYIPGNLLLLGEYAITVSGGKGIGIAVDSSVKIESEQAVRLSITCNFQGEQCQWVEGSPFPEKLRLIECILKNVWEHLAKKATSTFNFPIKITIDSSNFYYDSGRKKGYGSSAAVTVGLAYLLLHHAYSKAPDLARISHKLSGNLNNLSRHLRPQMPASCRPDNVLSHLKTNMTQHLAPLASKFCEKCGRCQIRVNVMRRGRKCLDYLRRFTAFETIDLTIQVLKKDGNTKVFNNKN